VLAALLNSTNPHGRGDAGIHHAEDNDKTQVAITAFDIRIAYEVEHPRRLRRSPPTPTYYLSTSHPAHSKPEIAESEVS
jgi:hypothetical protein